MSANYSGAGFSDMYFNVDAVPAKRFAQWVSATRTTGPLLDAQTYADLVKPSQAVAPYTYRAVAPGLFGGITKLEFASTEPSPHTHLAAQRADQ
jgi:cytochrome o ubiquinol oxidase subunit 2